MMAVIGPWRVGGCDGLALARGVAAGPARAEQRSAHGDVDRGDRGDGVGAAVISVEVTGGGVFDLAGAEAGTAGGQQSGQDGAADDAGQVSGAVGEDSAGGGGSLACCFEGGGEARPVEVGAGSGLGGGDRDSKFTCAFDAVLADAGIRTVLCNIQTPRMTAIAERWIGGCRRELPDRTLVRNQARLRQILRQYETLYRSRTRCGGRDLRLSG
jgi:hypothetical protein